MFQISGACIDIGQFGFSSRFAVTIIVLNLRSRVVRRAIYAGATCLVPGDMKPARREVGPQE